MHHDLFRIPGDTDEQNQYYNLVVMAAYTLPIALNSSVYKEATPEQQANGLMYNYLLWLSASSFIKAFPDYSVAPETYITCLSTKALTESPIEACTGKDWVGKNFPTLEEFIEEIDQKVNAGAKPECETDSYGSPWKQNGEGEWIRRWTEEEVKPPAE
jgi:hypothetical protein